MKRLNRIAASLIIATSLLLTACFGKDVEQADEPEEVETISPVAYDDTYEIAELAESAKRKRADVAELARAKAEVERRAAVEVKRKKLAAAIASKPKDAPVQPSRSQAYVDKAQTYEATFYTAFCPTGCTGVTASGYDVSSTIYYEGMRILAAPKHIPLYSIMRVKLANGTSFDGIVLDRGGDIGVGRLDILVETRQEAYVLGRQSVEVRMIRKGR